MSGGMELYLHMPFCVRKCAYCDFLSFPSGAKTQRMYAKRLMEDIGVMGKRYGEIPVETIFIGGGTPSVPDSGLIVEIMEHVRHAFHVVDGAEISMEANPGTVTREKLTDYRKAGINRLSFGLQSANDRELKLLGRIHTWAEFLESFTLARECGFANLNIDLMSALPGQTCESWKETLSRVTDLDPEHISAYSLIIEEGTPFYEKYGEGERAEARRRRELPDEDTERMMYQFTKNILWSYGYHRYEISNYAKEGYECRHNLGYWNRTEYLGIGTGAASLINNQRFVEGGEIEVLSLQNQMEEYMFLGLRKIEGVSKTDFRQTFGRSIENAYGKVLIDMYQKQLLEDTGEYIRLTEKGIDVSNYVMSEFLF